MVRPAQNRTRNAPSRTRVPLATGVMITGTGTLLADFVISLFYEIWLDQLFDFDPPYCYGIDSSRRRVRQAIVSFGRSHRRDHAATLFCRTHYGMRVEAVARSIDAARR